MFRFDEGLKVFLHRDAVDGRKGINGLVALVEQALKLDPFAPAVYVFTNKRRDRVKLILWNRTGFWLLLKRLEADRFAWPRETAVLELTVEQLFVGMHDFGESGKIGDVYAKFDITTEAVVRAAREVVASISS